MKSSLGDTELGFPNNSTGMAVIANDYGSVNEVKRITYSVKQTSTFSANKFSAVGTY